MPVTIILAIIEETYGIDLTDLVRFAAQHYQANSAFMPVEDPNQGPLTRAEKLKISQVQQALAIMQFKLELTVIKRHPEFNMDHRLLLSQVDFKRRILHLQRGRNIP